MCPIEKDAPLTASKIRIVFVHVYTVLVARVVFYKFDTVVGSIVADATNVDENVASRETFNVIEARVT
jgi:hypothetical protein